MPRPNSLPAEYRFPSFPWQPTAAPKDQQSGEWKDITDWHNIVIWKTEHVATYLTKGSRIYVEGRLETRTYDDKEGQKKYFTEVVCEAQNLVLLGSVEPWRWPAGELRRSACLHAAFAAARAGGNASGIRRRRVQPGHHRR